MRIDVLGPLRVVADTEIDLPRASHRRLLSILALDAGRRVSTDVLIDRNWGETAPATAKAALQTHVSALRKLLPADVLVTEGYGYRLDLDGHECDADELAELVVAAREAAASNQWDAALIAADAALGLWRGAPYEELRDDDFARAEIARLEELRVELLEQRAGAMIERGREEELLAELERLVVEHPLRERLWGLLMTARYRVGRHAEALAAYREAWSAFAEVGLQPSDALRLLEQKILVHDPALVTPSGRHNLPVALTGFVGRSEELAAIATLLEEHRLVTLTGVGGVGKTRLALEVVAHLVDTVPDGCWLAELAPLREREALVHEVASALGVRPQTGAALDAVQASIASDTVLVVLDNCEHLVDDAAAVARALLEAGPGVRVLATSREPLRVPGEAVYVVPPLSVPRVGAAADELARSDAVALFRGRAALVRPTFEIDETTAAAVTRICRRLDGIPLAIELAAGRVGAPSVDTIAGHLDDRFRLLTDGSSSRPERHMTLEAALDWSHDLLDASEQTVLARLGVFRNGFTLEAARSVCSGGPITSDAVVSLVSALVDKSLVSSYEAGSERYRLLETVRDYARRHLGAGDDEQATEARHCAWAVDVAADIVSRAHAFDRWTWLEQLDVERENLEAARDWSDGHGLDDDSVVLSRALALDAWYAGQFARCVWQLEDALSRPIAAHDEATSRSFLSAARFFVGESETALRESERAVEIFAGLPASPDKASSLGWRARLQLLLVDRDPAAAVPVSRAALAAAGDCAEPFAEIIGRIALGRALAWNGDVETGLKHHRLALGIARAAEDPAAIVDTVESMFDLHHLGPERRTGPVRLAEEAPGLLPPGEDLVSGGWHVHFALVYAYLQSGRWHDAETAIDRFGGRWLEGWERIGHLLTRGSLAWMQGRLDHARRDLAELDRAQPSPRWHADLYPLLAEVAAEEGRIDHVRAAAEAYLSLCVHASREADKLAVLSPLVRAEIDAATRTEATLRADHVERAEAALGHAREIMDTHPPLVPGSLRFETPATHLAITRAELSRFTGPDPTLWEDVVARADYVYSRLYAQWRLAEALLATERTAAGTHELRAAHDAATQTGAEGLCRRLEGLAATAGVPLGSRARSVEPDARRRAARRATPPARSSRPR